MKKTVWQFGLLILLLILVSQLTKYSLVLPGWNSEWVVGLFAVSFLSAGFFARKMWLEPNPTDNQITTPLPPLGAAEKSIALGISQRETEVLQLMAQGFSNQEIGTRLYISESTVKTHVSNILMKLDARRRTEAINKAREIGLI